MATQELYEPASRFRHVSFLCNDRLYVWGGRTVDYKSGSEDSLIKLGNCIEQFDPCHEVWRQLYTEGTPHPGLLFAACASVGENVYMYGGYCGNLRYYEIQGVLSKLNLKTLTWSQLSPGTACGPMRKYGCGLIIVHDKLVLIGGFGIPTGPIQPQATFRKYGRFTDGIGWSNEIHEFNISQGLWSSPTVRGVRPPPCAGFTLTSTDNHRAIMFGGIQPGRGIVNDLYIVDINTMEFTKVEPSEGEPWPAARTNHATCCIGYAGDHIHLLVSGGRSRDNKPLNDVWLFDLSLKKWMEVILPDGTLPRWGHSVTTITVCPGLEDVTMFGGTSDQHIPIKPESDYHRISETTIITLGQLGSEWVLVGMASSSQRGNSERVRDKIILKNGTDTQGSPFDPEGRVTSYALYKVEREGVQLRSGISSKNRDFQGLLCLRQPDANSALIKWLNNGNKSDIKPTWRNLLLVLYLVNLDKMAEQLEAYLGWTCLKQLPTDTSNSYRVQDLGSEDVTPNSVFTMASLTRLEAVAKIPVLTELKAKSNDFQRVIQVKQPNISWAINKWLTTSVLSCIKPTWKNLLLVLRLIHLDNIADQIVVHYKPYSAGEDVQQSDYCVVM